jgi:hypothetical protein
VRFPLTIAALSILALAGCASPQQKLAKQQAKIEQLQKTENTRLNEQRRMLAVENGEVNSKRGAEVLQYDPNKGFDPNRATAAAAHDYGTGKASAKSFYSDRQLRLDTFQARNFNAKTNTAAERKYSTADASTKGKYLMSDATKSADTKTAATKEAWDANKTSASRPLADGRRPYLGPESKKLGVAVDPKEMANWRNAGEQVSYTDSTIEKVSTLKQLSIDDIRELLNKSK